MTYKNIFIILIILMVAAVLYFFNDKLLPENKLENRKVSEKMSFFITSKNPGNGAAFGGLSGADEYCTTLATTAGVDQKKWAAYLSQTGENIINAKDRIGTGPWHNFNGELIANNVAELHNDKNNLNKNTALNELGEIVKGRGDTPNEHDILTGSDMLGNAVATNTDTTCNNWTSNDLGSAFVGHHDRIGRDDSAPMKSWVSSHLTRGCSLEKLKVTGGNGLIYCFAK